MRTTCPACRSPLTALEYTAGTDGSDPAAAACEACGCEVWLDGTYHHENRLTGGLGVRRNQGETTYREVSIYPSGSLVVAAQTLSPYITEPWGNGEIEHFIGVEPDDRPTVLVMLCIELFDKASDLTRFCRTRSIPVHGTGRGALHRFAVDDGALDAEAAGTLTVPAPYVDRFTLGAVRSLWRGGRRFATKWDWIDWLKDHAVAFTSHTF